MSPDKRARLTLFLALLLLALSGIGASVAIIRLYLSENWVRHTYTVEVAIGDLESTLGGVGRNRVAYIDSLTPKSLQDFQNTIRQVPLAIAKVRSLTSDNPDASPLCDRLQAVADKRVAASVESVNLAQQHSTDTTRQMVLTGQIASSAIDTAVIEQEMRDAEDKLLAERTRLTELLFTVTVGILIVSFTLSAVMFWVHNRMLHRELRNRESAEHQLRELSVQLMRVRDDEARRFARELHDGLGQNMVAAQMLAESLSSAHPADQQIEDLAKLVHEVASQTRTISYLLHPPMLDELGFAAAAEWFIEGFTQRTGVAVSTNISSEAKHLPKDLELALFRILQEALTNIHRHSQSATADVSVSVKSRQLTLIVSDQGKGIPPETLSRFKSKGTHVGVGLAGMKERVTELNGELEIRSGAAGTTIVVKLPVVARQQYLSAPVA